MSAGNDPLQTAPGDSHARPSGKHASRSTRLISRRQTDVEILRIVESVQAGNLSERASLAEFEGLDLELMQGVNKLLDTLTASIRNSTSALGQALQGREPGLLTAAAHGELRRFQDVTNLAAAALVQRAS